MKYLHERQMKVLELPPQSPDQNIIENLRRDLKNAVHARPNNISELRCSARKNAEQFENWKTLVTGSFYELF